MVVFQIETSHRWCLCLVIVLMLCEVTFILFYFSDTIMDEEDSKPFNIAITKLKTTYLQKDISRNMAGNKKKIGEAVYECLKNHFETPIDEFEDNKPLKSIIFYKLEQNEEFYLVHCVVSKTKKSNIKDAEQPQDNNNGEIWFLYWGDTVKDLNIFCFLKSRNTNAWSTLTKYRDFDFPKMFAKAFLNPEGIVKITTNNLTGIARGNQTRSYSKDNMFNPSDIIDRFAIVEEMKAPIENKKMIKLLNIDNPKKTYATMQQGQIKLPIKTQREFIPQLKNLKMVKHIHDTIHNNTDDFINDPRWRFLDHCKLVNSNAFNEKLKMALLELYKDSDQEVELIDLDSRLSYKHQDSFESSIVELSFKGTKYEWKSGGDLNGLSITVRDILDALRAGKVELANSKDIDNITLTFYDNADGCEVTDKLISMLMSVDLVKDSNGNQRYTQIKCGSLVFNVTIDSYYEVFYRFLEAVKDCVLKDHEVKPDILPWNFTNVDFTIEELHEFCSVSSDDTPKQRDIKKLREILCEEVSLFHEQSKLNNVLGDLENTELSVNTTKNNNNNNNSSSSLTSNNNNSIKKEKHKKQRKNKSIRDTKTKPITDYFKKKNDPSERNIDTHNNSNNNTKIQNQHQRQYQLQQQQRQHR